jgi:hypothetical protein
VSVLPRRARARGEARRASRQEVAETAPIAAALRAGAALTHGTLALRRFDEA